MTTTVDTPRVSPFSRWASLTKAEFVLLRRNALQLFYALIMPLAAPFLFRDLADVEGVHGLLASVITLIVLFGLVFVAFYNPLSAIVNRREESVLQRLRGGEVSDATILTSVSAPGFLIGVLMAFATIAISVPALGLDIPVNIPLMIATILVTAAMFVVMAFATSISTRTAESAQITSMPFIILVFLGAAVPLMPDTTLTLYQIGQFLPTAPVAELLSASWFGPVDFAELGQPLLILLAWTVLPALYAAKRFRWAKRS